MGIQKKTVETLDFLKMVERMVRAGRNRVANADEHELQAFYQLKLVMDQALEDAVNGQLQEGKSWQNIGDALGMSRQGAFRRFSK